MLNKRITVHYAGEVGPLNPDEHGGWAFVIHQNEDLIHQDAGHFGLVGLATDKSLEFFAAEQAMTWLLSRKKENQHIRFYGNEEMVVHQANGLWRPKSGPYMTLYMEALNRLNTLKLEFKDLRFTWVAKPDNAAARGLARRALREQGVTPSSERFDAERGLRNAG